MIPNLVVPAGLRVLNYVKGSSCVVGVLFLGCGHIARELDDRLDSLARRGCVQCRVTRLPSRERGNGSQLHIHGGRAPGQAAKLVEDHR